MAIVKMGIVKDQTQFYVDFACHLTKVFGLVLTGGCLFFILISAVFSMISSSVKVLIKLSQFIYSF